ncbi:hypothetical protein Q7P37_003419 [Cladosporium fusiforme]
MENVQKRATTSPDGGLSYEAITAITICVAGFVMMMVLACAINLRRKKGDEQKVDASDLDREQQSYMREVRYRNRDTLTGTTQFTAAALANPQSQPNAYMSRSDLSSYGYDNIYTPGFDSGRTTKRSSAAYVDSPPTDVDHLRSPDPADAEYFNHKAPPVGQPIVPSPPEQIHEKPIANSAVYEAEPAPYPQDDQPIPPPHTDSKA